jgi:phosphatidylinositol kinase/protein kinase (PI-3  family)
MDLDAMGFMCKRAGSFRITCENVMEVLRGNRDSLMAMLEVGQWTKEQRNGRLFRLVSR